MKEKNKGNVIKSPEGASWNVEEEHYDASDSGSRFIITVHSVNPGNSAVNVWLKSPSSHAYRVVPEKEIPLVADPLMLIGGVNSLEHTYEKRIAGGDEQTRLAISALRLSAIDLVNNFSNRN